MTRATCCHVLCRDPMLPQHEADAMVLTSLLQIHAAVEARGANSSAHKLTSSSATAGDGDDDAEGSSEACQRCLDQKQEAVLRGTRPSAFFASPSRVVHVVATLHSTEARAASQACLNGLAALDPLHAQEAEGGRGASAGCSFELLIPEE